MRRIVARIAIAGRAQTRVGRRTIRPRAHRCARIAVQAARIVRIVGVRRAVRILIRIEARTGRCPIRRIAARDEAGTTRYRTAAGPVAATTGARA